MTLNKLLNLIQLDLNFISRRLRLGLYLSTFILSSTLSCLIYNVFDLHQNYTQLIVGSITWDAGSKFHDYLLLFSFVFSSIIVLKLLSVLFRKIQDKYGEKGLKKYDHLNLILSSPAGFWFLSLLITKNQSLFLFFLSAFFLFVANIFGLIFLSKKEEFWTARDI